MKVELLYFEGCPSWQTALENLKVALQEEGISKSTIIVGIKDDGQAELEKFLGSPSIRIDGHDLWPEQRVSYSFNCMVYGTPEGVKGYPTVEMLRSKIWSAVSGG